MLSICMPTYNYAHYIGEALDSCLSQDEDFELVVFDDASTDNTLEVLDTFRHDKRLKIVAAGSRIPTQDAFNASVAACSQPWIKMLHADDKLLPGAVGSFKDMIRADRGVAFHGFLAHMIDAHGNTVRRHRPYTPTGETMALAGDDALRAKLRQIARFKEPTCNMYRKDAWQAAGGYQKKYPGVFDMQFNVRMMQANRCALWSRYLVCVRRHGKSLGATIPKATNLAEMREFTAEVLAMMGGRATFSDQQYAQGWIAYRLMELCGRRALSDAKGTLRMLAENFQVVTNPLAMLQGVRLAATRLFHGDVQQQGMMTAGYSFQHLLHEGGNAIRGKLAVGTGAD